MSWMWWPVPRKSEAGRHLNTVLHIAVSIWLWNFGEPPVWTLFAPRAETVVLASQVQPTPDAAGNPLPLAVIVVEWPVAPGGRAQIADLQDVRGRRNSALAHMLVQEHPVGSKITVRMVRGLPVADITRLPILVVTVVMTVIAAALVAGSIVPSARLSRLPWGRGTGDST